MDYVNQATQTHSAAWANHATGRPHSPLVLLEFNLVSFDKCGCPQPLPAGLGHLPLYPDDDGFFSVNGPQDFTVYPQHGAHGLVNNSNHAMIPYLITNIPGYSCENPGTIPYRCPLDLNGNDIRSSSPVHSASRSYPCDEPGCTWRSSFLTRQALNRHKEVKHLNKRVDCPIAGCEKVGDNGIKRKDNLPAHVLNKHGIKLPRQSLSN